MFCPSVSRLVCFFLLSCSFPLTFFYPLACSLALLIPAQSNQSKAGRQGGPSPSRQLSGWSDQHIAQ
jgi:hypothetical protein